MIRTLKLAIILLFSSSLLRAESPNACPNYTITTSNVVCPGAASGQIIITAPNATACTYTWTGPVSGTLNSSTGVTITNLTAGIYSISVNDGGTTCIESVTITQPSLIAGPSQICAGAGATLSASTATSYSWSMPGGQTSALQNIVATALGSYSVTADLGGGCTATASRAMSFAPSITSSSLEGGSTPVTVCPNATVTLSAAVNYMSLGSTVAWYYDNNASFDPSLGQGTLMNTTATASACPTACPDLLAIFINACGASGTEPNNEFLILESGNGFSVNDLIVDYNTSNNSIPPNPGNPNDLDIDVNGGGCSYQVPLASLITNLRAGSCNSSNIIPAGPGDVVPAGALVFVFTSNNVNTTYDLTSLCAQGKTIYILQSSCARSGGAFTNSASCSTTPATRYHTTTLRLNNCPNCSDRIVVDRCSMPNSDGTYATDTSPNDTASVGNNALTVNTTNACNGPDVTTIPVNAPPQDFSYPVPSSFCNTTRFVRGMVSPMSSNGCPTPLTQAFELSAACPSVTATPANGVICNRTATNISLTASSSSATLTWSPSIQGSVTGANSGNGSFINQTLTNNGGTPATVTYNITATEATCISTTSVVVIVNPTVANVTASNAIISCANPSVTLTASAGQSYSWSDGQSGNPIVVLTPATYIVTISDTNGCTSTASTVVGGSPQPGIVRAQEQCNILGTQYTWVVTVSGGAGLTVTGVPGTLSGNVFTSSPLTAGQSFTISVADNGGCPAVTLTSSGACNTPQACFLVGCVGPNLIQDPGFENFNFASPTTFFTTSYPHNGPCVANGNNCGNSLCQGQFAVSNAVLPCNPTWANITDHTTGTGNLMLVDYNNNSSQAIWCSTVTLQPATEYCYGAWLANLLPAGSNRPRPQVRFEVSGQSIGVTPDIPENNQWNFHSYSFNSGAGGNVNVCFYNQNFGANGFDLAIDDITLRAGTGGTPPSANAESFTICPGITQVTVTPMSNDVSGTNPILPNSLIITQAPAPSQGTAVVSGQQIRFTPAAGFTTATLIYQVCDFFGCCDTALVTFVNNPLQVSITPAAPVCSPATVTLQTSIVAGTPTNYLWNDGTNGTNVTTTSAGTFTVTVSDAAGCSATAQSTATIDNTPTPTFTGATVVCVNGTLAVTVSGASTYVWSGPNAFSSSNAAISIPNATVAQSGNYQVTASTVAGCSATASVNLVVNPNPVLVVSSTNPNCTVQDSGTASTTATSGQQPYTYAWSNGQTTANITGLAPGQYCVTLTDDNGCQANNCVTVGNNYIPVSATFSTTPPTCPNTPDGGVSATLTGGTGTLDLRWPDGRVTVTRNDLPAGTFAVTVTDNAVNCESVFNVTLTNPSAVSITTITVTNVSCFGAANGSIDIDVTGGTPIYTYLWSDLSTNQDVSALTQGQYRVTVTDNTGCFATASFNITEPAALGVTLTPGTIACLGGTTFINSAANGGTTPYSYLWDDGTTLTNATGMPAGLHELTVTDANGCTVSQNVLLVQNTGINIVATTINPTCSYLSNGRGFTNAIGGLTPYTYLWSNGEVTSSTNNLPDGPWSVTVTDASGCAKDTSGVVVAPPQLGINSTVTGISCFGQSDGEITIQITGGTPSYNVDWESGNVGLYSGGLPGGLQRITITDANGCTGIIMPNIPSPTPLEVSVTSADVTCNGALNGYAVATPAGGTAAYNYIWDNGFIRAQNTSLGIGTYKVTVIDANGCTVTAPAVTISQPAPIVLTTSVIDIIKCHLDSNATAQVTATGGLPFPTPGPQAYTYYWSNRDATQIADSLAAGVYFVTVMDSEGCRAFGQVTVADAIPLFVTITEAPILCEGDEAILEILADPLGGRSPYLYSLDAGATFDTIRVLEGLNAGDYRFIVKDAYGCRLDTTYTVLPADTVRIDLPYELNILIGDSIQFDAQITIPLGHTPILQWTPANFLSCTSCPNPNLAPWQTTRYALLLTDDVTGCTDTASILVRVRKTRNVFIPTAFSPDGDGLNDQFFVMGGPGTSRIKSMVVFDRWGEQLFSANNIPLNTPGMGWDGGMGGQVLNNGVYIYYIEVEFVDGVVEIYKGDVTLIK